MPQYRIANPVRSDIVRLSQTRFGDQARLRYQALILTVLQALAERLIRITDAPPA
jgi:toxin ParE1/3/4